MDQIQVERLLLARQLAAANAPTPTTTSIARPELMGPDLRERSSALVFTSLTALFLIIFHAYGSLTTVNYFSYLPMHLLTLSVGCLTVVVLTGLNLYSIHIRNLG